MIETSRLLIQPLTVDQLQKYLRNDFSLEEELRLKKIKRIITPQLRDALHHTILPNASDPEKNYLFCTLWSAISKDGREMVGEICFTDVPNQLGEIEIGYGTHEEFQNMGYMTEIVSGIIIWASSQPSILKIIANTDKTNQASFKVLLKNGFMLEGETEAVHKWVLNFQNKSPHEL